MALAFVDSFDHYTTVLEKWDTISGGTVTISSSFARSVGGIQLNSGYVRKNVTNAVTYIVGAYVVFHSTSTGQYQQIFRFWDNGSNQVSVGFDSSGHVVVKRNGSTIGTSTLTTTISNGTGHYIEVLCTVDDSAGVVTTKVDGTTVHALTGVDSKNTANAYSNQISVGSDSQFEIIYVDDVYMCDTSGATNNTFLGDVSIKCVFGNAAGFSTSLTPGGTLSGSNYGQTDDNPPNGDTDYVENATVTARDSYGFSDITLTGSIRGVQLLGYVKKDDAGSRSIALTARSNSVDSIGSTLSITQTYTFYRQIFELDPNTTAAWTVAGLNAAEFGLQIAA